MSRDVSLDLDALERPDDPGPFTFVLGGKTYGMADPQSMGFQQLQRILVAAQGGDLVVALSGLLDADDVVTFWEQDPPPFRLNALCDGWLEHYDLKPGEVAASSPSSNGTAGRSKRTSRSGR